MSVDNNTQVRSETVWAGIPAVVLSRVRVWDGSLATTSNINSVSYKAFDLNGDPSSLVDSGTLTVGNVLYDTLQMDGRWRRDGEGYNFAHTVDASVLATAGHRYWIEYEIDPSSGSPFVLAFEMLTQKRFG